MINKDQEIQEGCISAILLTLLVIGFVASIFVFCKT